MIPAATLPRLAAALALRSLALGSLALSSVLLGTGIAHADNPSPVSAPLVFVPCEIGSASTPLAVRADCAIITVPEDPDIPDGKTIELSVARLQAYGSQPADDPFTFLAGGPGQAAMESFASIHTAFDKIRQHRDIYLLDQRGTGKSSALLCPQAAEEQLDINFDARKIEIDSEICLQALNADPRLYTTSVAVQDLDRLRQRLGIELWNLYGVSYGTRVATHYLKRFPAHVRSIILDAVVPPDVTLGSSLAVTAERALNLMFERCQRDQACQLRFPQLRERTHELLRTLQESPRTITFENFQNGQLETLEFTANHLALTLRMMTYSSHGASLLPTMLHDAYTNQNFAPLARQATLQADNINQSIAGGMHRAVICTEDQPFVTLDDAAWTRVAATYLGTDSIAAMEATCAPWPQGRLDADFRMPVSSDIPVLILSGEADPITPPAFGERVLVGLKNALHIVNPGQAHVQAWLGCTPSIMARFVAAADVEEVDFGCLERQLPPPFFVDPNGPAP